MIIHLISDVNRFNIKSIKKYKLGKKAKILVMLPFFFILLQPGRLISWLFFSNLMSREPILLK